MDKGDFFLWDTHTNEFLFEIVIDVEFPVVVRGGEVAEDHLCGALLSGALPDFKDISGTGRGLAVLMVRQHFIHQPLIQGELSAVVGDEQHVVLIGGNHLVSHSLGTFG